MPSPINISYFQQLKRKHRRIVMLTSYDAPSAAMVHACGADMVLVGDSVGTVLLGYTSTAPVTMDEMIHHSKAARRGAPDAFLVGDMPLEAVKYGVRRAVAAAVRFVKEAGCEAVKIEWNEQAPEMTRAIVKHGIPLIGHVGLTPQSVGTGQWKVQGTEADDALRIYDQAVAFQSAGAFAVVLECVPLPVAQRITRDLRIPTIGIGAGPYCDGQILVLHDMLGWNPKFNPRFIKHYAELHKAATAAIGHYLKDVRGDRYPRPKHSYKMDAAQLKRFNFLYDRKGRAT